jgi:hypothetical protein
MEEKLKLLQEMASSESDLRDGNIGSFSQWVVVGERNSSSLALEIIESIKRGDKEPYIPSPFEFVSKEEIENYEKGERRVFILSVALVLGVLIIGIRTFLLKL